MSWTWRRQSTCARAHGRARGKRAFFESPERQQVLHGGAHANGEFLQLQTSGLVFQSPSEAPHGLQHAMQCSRLRRARVRTGECLLAVAPTDRPQAPRRVYFTSQATRHVAFSLISPAGAASTARFVCRGGERGARTGSGACRSFCSPGTGRPSAWGGGTRTREAYHPCPLFTHMARPDVLCTSMYCWWARTARLLGSIGGRTVFWRFCSKPERK